MWLYKLKKGEGIALTFTIILDTKYFQLCYMVVKHGLTLREKYRLRVFENRISRRIFGSKRDKNREWRRLHNDELHGLHLLLI
jgi:hypothetical protein